MRAGRSANRTSAVSPSVRRIMPWLALVALSRSGPTASGEVPIVEVELHAVGALGTRLVPEVVTPPGGLRDARAIVAQAVRPLGWFEPVDVRGDGGAFVSRAALDLPCEARTLHAWLVGHDLIGALRQQWPIEVELRAKIDTVGLAAARRGAFPPGGGACSGARRDRVRCRRYVVFRPNE